MSKEMSNTKRNNVKYIIYLALIILPLYFKGSYFEQAYLPFIVSMSIFTLIHIRDNYRVNRETLIKDDTDLFLLLFTVLYGLTFFYGVNKRSSLIEFAKHVSYMSVFFISRDIGKDDKKCSLIMDVMILGGIVVAIIGVGTMIGTWQYTDSYSGTRLSSVFQYPNTLAVYVSAMYFLTMGQALSQENNKKLIIYGGILTIFFSTLIFTSSRGMWLLFPLILLIYFIILSSINKVRLFFYTIANLVIAIPFSFIFLKYLGSSQEKLWGIYLIGILLSSLAFYIIGFANKLISRISLKIVLAIIITMSIGTIGAIYFSISEIMPLTLENQIDVDNTSSISRSLRTVTPNTQYILNVEGIAENDEDKNFAGRVLIYSVDEHSNNKHIGTLDIVESGEYNLDYTFTTLEETVALRLYFQNQFGETSVTFENVSIRNAETQTTSTIPLKFKYIPEAIVSRVLSIGITENSAQARIIFSKDAMKLIKRNLLLGTGGDGWATSYKSVQSYPYWSKHVHNYFLQMIVEVGVLGFMFFLGFLFTIAYNYYKYKRRENSVDKVTIVDTLVVVIITIFAHATMDFDLSLVALAITLWTLLGLLCSMIYRGDNDNVLISKNMKLISTLSVILIIVTLIISSSIYGGLGFVQRALAAQENNDIDKLQSSMEIASMLDPYNTSYKSELINIYFYQYSIKSDASYGSKARSITDKLLDIGRFDSIAQNDVAQAYLKMGLIEDALGLIDNMVDMQPFVVEAYLQKTHTYLSLFEHYIKKLDLDKAKEIAIRGSSVENQLKDAYMKTIQPMGLDNELNLNILKLKYYGEHFDDYIKHLEKAQRLTYFYDFNQDINNDEEIDMLYSSIPEGSKIAHESMVEGENNFIRITNEGEIYGFKYVYPLSLEPNTTYIVELKARGNTRPETFNLYAWANGAADPNQGSLTGIELTDDWETYSFEFTTDEDVNPGNQYIRIQHNGNDMGHIDIMDLTIFSK